MVAWIATSEEEASALKRGAVGHESIAMVTLQAVQATAAVPAEDARFIVPLAEQATLVPHHEFSDHIPVIDLSGDPDASIAAVAHAAATWGIFQVVNHGVPESTMNKMMAMAKEFYALPEEKRMASAMDNTKDVPQGYSPISESFHRDASWSNVLGYVLRPQYLTTTDEFFPSASFRATLEEFGKGLNDVLVRLMELLLTTYLGANSGQRKFEELVGADYMQVFRVAAYEPCPQPEAVMGIRSHVDHTLVSALVQDDTGGLQVEKDGEWHGVAPVPGAIIVIIGTAFQMITNDVIKAAHHRAVVNSHSRRISLTTAINPSKDTVLVSVPELVDTMHPALYGPFKYSEFRVEAFEDGILNSRDTMQKFRSNPKSTHLVEDTIFMHSCSLQSMLDTPT